MGKKKKEKWRKETIIEGVSSDELSFFLTLPRCRFLWGRKISMWEINPYNLTIVLSVNFILDKCDLLLNPC